MTFFIFKLHCILGIISKVTERGLTIVGLIIVMKVGEDEKNFY